VLWLFANKNDTQSGGRPLRNQWGPLYQQIHVIR